MRAWVRTDRLTGLNLTTGDIISAIQAQNVQAAVGRIGARPIADDQQLQLNIQTKGRLSSAAEFEKHRRADQSGRLDAAARRRGAARTRRRQSRSRHAVQRRRRPAPIAIYQSPGANAITTLGAVKKRIDRAGTAASPKILPGRVTYDPTTFVTDTIQEVQKTLIEAFVLVVLVVFLFLGSIRATLIPTIAVPVSLIGTFVVLLAVGYSANTVSLLARRAGDRHRGRRRHRGGGERRAGDGGAAGAVARGGDQAGDARDHRADHRHHARAALGVRAGRVHSRAFPANCSASSRSRSRSRCCFRRSTR